MQCLCKNVFRNSKYLRPFDLTVKQKMFWIFKPKFLLHLLSQQPSVMEHGKITKYLFGCLA